MNITNEGRLVDCKWCSCPDCNTEFCRLHGDHDETSPEVLARLKVNVLFQKFDDGELDSYSLSKKVKELISRVSYEYHLRETKEYRG